MKTWTHEIAQLSSCAVLAALGACSGGAGGPNIPSNLGDEDPGPGATPEDPGPGAAHAGSGTQTPDAGGEDGRTAFVDGGRDTAAPPTDVGKGGEGACSTLPSCCTSAGQTATDCSRLLTSCESAADPNTCCQTVETSLGC